jgi:anti-anti-sigma factor
MKITTRDSADMKIVDVEGKLDSNSSDEAQKYLAQLMDQGVSEILINFKNLEFIGSAGLRVLLLTQKRLKASGGEIRICNANEQVQSVFGSSGFNKFLTIFNSESDALL